MVISWKPCQLESSTRGQVIYSRTNTTQLSCQPRWEQSGNFSHGFSALVLKASTVESSETHRHQRIRGSVVVNPTNVLSNFPLTFTIYKTHLVQHIHFIERPDCSNMNVSIETR
jgi:hypothetical protein